MFAIENLNIGALRSVLHEAVPSSLRGAPLWTLAVVLPLTYTALRGIYLLYFHPLSKFPGPKLAAVSNVYYGISWLSGRYPWILEQLFQKYGDVVRIAPNELVFCSPQSYYDIHASAVKNRETFTKTSFQEIGEKEPGITAEKDPDVHRSIARQLQPAFGTRALKEQEPTLNEHVDDFICQIKEHGMSGDGIDMKEWIDWLAFDIAGDMAYGREFRHVKDAKSSVFLSTFQRVGLWGTINQVFKRYPLLHPFVWFLIPPSVVLTVPTLLRLNRQEVRARVERRDNLRHPDYIQQLLHHESAEKGDLPSEDWLLAQANVLIVAGFDPITNLLSAIVYYLGKSPETTRRLVDEVRGAFASYEDINSDALQNLKYLQAVLEEGLRIHTNAAFGLPRLSPGATVDGHYIPKRVVTQVCHFATTHDARNFHLPREFHPERFLQSSHPLYENRFADDNKKAYAPFSLGPRGCPGMRSTWMQCRLIMAKLVWKFDMELTNADKIDWEKDLRMYAIWSRPSVMVRFTEVQ